MQNTEFVDLLQRLDNDVTVSQETLGMLNLFVHKIDKFLLIAKYSYCLGVCHEQHKKVTVHSDN